MNAAADAQNLPQIGPLDGGYGHSEFGASWQEARGVIIAVHGRDRDAAELPGLLADLAEAGGWRVLAPAAPGRSWYPGRFDAPLAEIEPGRSRALDQIEAMLALAGRHGHADAAVVLVGFSQGACLVAEFLLSGRRRPGAAAIFTGAHMRAAPETGPAALAGLPVVISGGQRDAWLPVASLFATTERLEQCGANVHLEIFPDADHLVRPEEVALLEELCGHVLGSHQ